MGFLESRSAITGEQLAQVNCLWNSLNRYRPEDIFISHCTLRLVTNSFSVSDAFEILLNPLTGIDLVILRVKALELFVIRCIILAKLRNLKFSYLYVVLSSGIQSHRLENMGNHSRRLMFVVCYVTFRATYSILVTFTILASLIKYMNRYRRQKICIHKYAI